MNAVSKLMRVFCFLLLSILMVACNNRDQALQDRRASQEKATPMIEAIEAHFEDTGEYPAQIEELVPEYLTDIPTDFRGDEYRYHVTSLGYYLCFGDAHPYKCCFHHVWDCTPGD